MTYFYTENFLFRTTRLQGYRPMYPECVAFLRKTMRVREIVILVHLSHSHGFAQKRNAFRIHGTAPLRTGKKHAVI